MGSISFCLLCLIFPTIVAYVCSTPLCPCGDTWSDPRRMSVNQQSRMINLCSTNSSLLSALAAEGLSSSFNLQHLSTIDQSVLASCESILSIGTLTDRTVCPNACHPVVETILPDFLFVSSIETLLDTMHLPLTCSLTTAMILRKYKQLGKTSNQTIINFLATEIVWRRLYECNENWKEFHLLRLQQIRNRDQQSTNTTARYAKQERTIDSIVRRRVESVVIWIGTVSKIDLSREQASVLSHLPWHGTSAVLPWVATDVMYPCAENATLCTEQGGNKRFKGLMPNTNMNFNGPGWRCAQRRPLRSLGHVLQLFNPEFVVLLDDDTFLNYKLLISRFGTYLHSEMHDEPLVMGEYTGKEGPNGHMSLGGIWAGGSGYIIGHKALSRLNDRYIKEYGFEGIALEKGLAEDLQARNAYGDKYRSHRQVITLSLLDEALDRIAMGACGPTDNSPSAGKCIGPSSFTSYGLPGSRSSGSRLAVSVSAPLQGMRPIGVRLIDFCINLMATDNTCLHSDHSVSRCLMYGAHADPVSVVCHSSVALLPGSVELQNFERLQVRVGMCFYSPTCDIDEQITCHRYKASWQHIDSAIGQAPLLNPVRTHAPGYYRLYSSMFDGNRTDTY